MVKGGVSGVVRNNVYLGGGSIAGSPRGYALEIANIRPGKNTEVYGNVFAHDTVGASAAVVLSVGRGTYERDAVGINKEVVVLGVRERIEIWDRAEFERYRDAHADAYENGDLEPRGARPVAGSHSGLDTAPRTTEG